MDDFEQHMPGLIAEIEPYLSTVLDTAPIEQSNLTSDQSADQTSLSARGHFEPDEESYFESIAKTIPDIPILGSVCSCKRPRDGSLCVIS